MLTGAAAARVHLVVPTLAQRPDWLLDCVESLAGQDEALALTLVVPIGTNVDFVAARHRCEVREQDRGGLSAAINIGLEGAVAPYCGWLGDDDLLTRGSVRMVADALDAAADAPFGYGQCRVIDSSGHTLRYVRPGRLALWLMRYGVNYLPQPGSLMRTSAFRAVGGLDESLRYAMDLDVFLKLQRQGRPVYVPQEVSCYRWHEGALTSTKPDNRESDQVRERYVDPRVVAWSCRALPALRLVSRGWGWAQARDPQVRSTSSST